MKKFVVFKKEEVGYATTKRFSYTSEEVGGFLILNGNSTGVNFVDYKLDNSTHFSHMEVPPLAYHFELPSGLHEDTVLPIEVSATSIPAEVASGGVASETEGFIYILQEDAGKVADKLVQDKTDLVTAAYNQMNTDVYAQMYVVFGTKNPESATAYHDTWKLMSSNPSEWSSIGLTSNFDRGGLVKGDALDTVQKIQDYSDACLAEVNAYGVWRMQRIEQFKVERATLLAS